MESAGSYSGSTNPGGTFKYYYPSPSPVSNEAFK